MKLHQVGFSTAPSCLGVRGVAETLFKPLEFKPRHTASLFTFHCLVAVSIVSVALIRQASLFQVALGYPAKLPTR